MTGKEALQQTLQQPVGEEEQRHAEDVLQLLTELIDAWCLLDGDTDTEELLDLSEEEMQRELDCLDNLLCHCEFVSEECDFCLKGLEERNL